MNQENGEPDEEASLVAANLCDYFAEQNIMPGLAFRAIEILRKQIRRFEEGEWETGK